MFPNAAPSLPVLAAIALLALCFLTALLRRARSVDFRVRRLEKKLDLICNQLGIDFPDSATASGLSEDVRRLADDPGKKIAAIKLHRQQTGVGLNEAKEAVEAYIQRSVE